MVTFITAIHIIACLFLVLTVLLQAGKGGGVGIAFGSGTSSAVFGGRGAGSFLERLTAGTAIVFMLTSMTLAWYASQSDSARLQKIAIERAAKQKVEDKKVGDKKAEDAAIERARTTLPPAGSASTVPATTPTTPTDKAEPAEKAAPTTPTAPKPPTKDAAKPAATDTTDTSDRTKPTDKATP